jgi:hypothetical protein
MRALRRQTLPIDRKRPFPNGNAYLQFADEPRHGFQAFFAVLGPDADANRCFTHCDFSNTMVANEITNGKFGDGIFSELLQL